MSVNTSSSTALLTEHLRYTPVSLIDDVINSINTIGYKAVDWVEQGLLGTPLANLGFSDSTNDESNGDLGDIEAHAQQEIENGVHQFETLLEATIDKNFDKMEIFALRSIIAIPDDLKDWIRLRHYEGLNLTPSLTPDTPTLDSITLQRRKHQETLRLHRLLQAEAARNAALIHQLKSLLSLSSPSTLSTSSIPTLHDADTARAAHHTTTTTTSHPTPPPAFAFLSRTHDLAASSATTPLSTTTAFALSQLPAMKTLLADLRPSLTALSSTPSVSASSQPPQAQTANVTGDGSGAAAASASWRTQRLEYVEAQTRRLQESVRGLELGEQGRVRDGEWQEGGGGGVGRGEVEALERVVGMVGGGKQEGGGERMEVDG